MSMYRVETPGSDPLVESILGLAKSVCNAASAIFYWPTQSADVESLVFCDVPRSLHGLQFDSDIDPLSLRRLAARNSELAFLSLEPVADREQLQLLQRQHGFSDEADLLFWNEHEVIGGISFFRGLSGGRFQRSDCDWMAMRKHFELVLKRHRRVRKRIAARKLNEFYRLTAREQEVLTMIRTGASNVDIASSLNISIPTAKTHIVNILGKLGVESRVAAAAVVSELLDVT